MIVNYSATGMTGIQNININSGHTTPSTLATIECRSFSGSLGDLIDVYAGYDGSTARIFRGYVKQIEHQIPDNTYTVVANDVMTRAIDFFVAPDDPNNPYKRSNILTETLVGELLAMAGITDYEYDPTSFVIAYEGEVEVINVSVYDFCKQLADTITWSLWADSDGTVHFKNRKPYPMSGSSGQLGDDTDEVNASTDYTVQDIKTIDGNYMTSEKDLRNKVIVYGSGVNYTASAVSPYLPDGFYKTVVVGASTLLNTAEGVQLAAEYNLNMFNRLTTSFSCTVAGDNLLSARKVITINSTLFGLSGNWYIYTCEHNINSGGWTTSLDLRGSVV